MKIFSFLLVTGIICSVKPTEDLNGQDSIPGLVLLPPPVRQRTYDNDYRTVWTEESAQPVPVHQWFGQPNYDRAEPGNHGSTSENRDNVKGNFVYRSSNPGVLPDYNTDARKTIYGNQYLRQDEYSEPSPHRTVSHSFYPHDSSHIIHNNPSGNIASGTQFHIPHRKLVLTVANRPNFEEVEEHVSLYSENSDHGQANPDLTVSKSPKSLAALLAERLTNSRNPPSGNSHVATNKQNIVSNDDNTNTQNWNKPEAAYDDPILEYPVEVDYLYDEFIKTYYDEEAEQHSEDLHNEEHSPNSNDHKEDQSGHDFNIEVLQPPETDEIVKNADIQQAITPTEASNTLISVVGSSSPRTSTLVLSTTTELTTKSDVKKDDNHPGSFADIRQRTLDRTKTQRNNKRKPPRTSNKVKVSTKTKPRIRPLSLIEVIQKLDLTLPTFLAALTKHGKSLKEFNDQLSQTELNQSDFRRIRGDVGRLLETLNEAVPVETIATSSPPTSTFSATTPVEITTTSSLKIVSSTKSFGNSEPTQKELLTTTNKTPSTSTTTEASSSTQAKMTTEEVVTLAPVIFGSNSVGNIFTTKPNSEQPQQVKRNNKENITLSPVVFENSDGSRFLHGFDKMFNITDDMIATKNIPSTPPNLPDWASVSPKPYMEASEVHRVTQNNKGKSDWRTYLKDRKLIGNRFQSTQRPTFRPAYVIPSSPKRGTGFFDDNNKKSETENTKQKSPGTQESSGTSNSRNEKPKSILSRFDANSKYKINAHNADVATKSAILAAVILGSVALTVFIAIFIVVRYKNHQHKRKRRKHLSSLHSDSSTSSIPPLYATRSSIYRASYHSSGFWNSLKKKFDPYSIRGSPISDEQ